MPLSREHEIRKQQAIKATVLLLDEVRKVARILNVIAPREYATQPLAKPVKQPELEHQDGWGILTPAGVQKGEEKSESWGIFAQPETSQQAAKAGGEGWLSESLRALYRHRAFHGKR
ncbi:hypothetical protein SAMN05660653_03160 [Desulfonatronum thiosulfatophilum]|uniref:Uncharacterized protein n=1 Tax=Desulfonatronum thiosulfatophilum TaxID=617002 RepID=A0A1G6EUS0_9BACT|nr:hypothetical protein SAMN05660653_03160 [Desulfonatronum thiosulfatophilum]